LKVLVSPATAGATDVTKLHNKARWHRVARLQLLHEPLCRMCLADGRVEPATVADHIEPHHGDVNKFWLGKLQSLCRHCHESRKKFIERRGYDKAIGIDGWPSDPRHPVYRWR
jgi:5-methylcytosine-specific restriction enzyme A